MWFQNDVEAVVHVATAERGDGQLATRVLQQHLGPLFNDLGDAEVPRGARGLRRGGGIG